MKPLALITLLAAFAAPEAAAGDLSFGIGIGKRDGNKDVRVRVEYRNEKREAPRARRIPRSRPVVYTSRVWVNGYFKTVSRRVWVPGYFRKVWRPAEFGFRYNSCNERVRVVIRPAGYTRVHVPGHFETRLEKTWVPGHYEVRTHTPAHGPRGRHRA
jgi:hypothetical protein